MCRLTERAPAAGLAMPHPPRVAGSPAPAPAAANLLCEPCMAACGALSLQGPNTYLTGRDVSPQVSTKPTSAALHSRRVSQDLATFTALGMARQPVAATRLPLPKVECHVSLQAMQLQDGMPLACASGYCIPQQRPDLLQVCAAGTGRGLPGPTGQAGQPAAAPAAQAGRRLLAWVRVCQTVCPSFLFQWPRQETVWTTHSRAPAGCARRLFKSRGSIVRPGHVFFRDCPECELFKAASWRMLPKKVRVRWHVACEGRSATQLVKSEDY